jgi:hypothetical protein
MWPFERKIPPDLTPAQLQVILSDEKQETFYVYMTMLTIGVLAAAHWPAMSPLYGTYGGLMLAGLGAVLGVNVAHKVLNNRVITAGGGDGEEEEAKPGEAKPDPKK